MTRSLHTVELNDTVADALAVMVDGVNTLPVIDDKGRCVGIISRTDLTEFLYREDQSFSDYLEAEGAPLSIFGRTIETCNDRLVRELMTDSVTFAEESTTVRQACKLMSTYGIHHLPVVNCQRKLVGLVSSLDLIRMLAGQP